MDLSRETQYIEVDRRHDERGKNHRPSRGFLPAGVLTLFCVTEVDIFIKHVSIRLFTWMLSERKA